MKCQISSKVVLLFILTLITATSLLAQSLVEDLAIEVKGSSREYSFTNKESAFLYGETHGENKSSWQGFNVFGHEFLNDYQLFVDGKRLDRSTASRVIVYPDYLKRVYRSGIAEEVRAVDSLPLFSVIVTSSKPVNIEVRPFFADGRSAEDFQCEIKSEIAFIARKSHLTRLEKENFPVWLAVHGAGFLPQLAETKNASGISPVRLSAHRAKVHTITFCVADNQAQAEQSALHYAGNAASYHAARRSRMEKLLQQTYVRTDNARFNKALAWAKLSLDALIMNQVTKGIFAGLPWFNNYWGRDTFIALPGATLVLGRFTEAKEILRSFAAYQQLDTSSTDYGRIPNIVTTTDKAYNTADGTPRFVMMVREYIERSGDTTFLNEIYPTVIRSIEGTLKHHCDSLGFLTHADAETWMDAVGPDGPWSPRGNRANDIQALWAQQLDAGIWFATRLGDAISASKWNGTRKQLQDNFPKYFVTKGVPVDHLNRDGSHDNQLRPNQIFTHHLVDENTRATVVQQVVNKLTYKYGVASLSQDGENFHPYHQYEPYYPKDAAYHNGTVWTWVQGQLISELCHFNQQELAGQITENTVHQILDRGAVGTQSELIDAIARPKEREPLPSGTFSQAWNLAEFIRNFYDDYLGINISLLNHHLTLRPKLPRAFGSISATINLNGRSLPIQITSTRESTVVLIDGKNLRKGGTAEIAVSPSDSREIQTTLKIPPSSETLYRLKGKAVSLYINGVIQNSASSIAQETKRYPPLTSLQFALPKLRENLRSLRGPDYPVLSQPDIKRRPSPTATLISADDPAGDDLGTGAYTYPANPAFVRGSFDLRQALMSYDNKNAYFALKFSALSNPGWHPEYGFQLTFVAIAIDEDGKKDSGERMIGRNANYLLPDNRAYEKIIYVGGGIQLEDRNGKILTGYIPIADDVKNPLGNSQTGVISFAIPLSYLGKPTPSWTLTILSGAQDDHGGAGLGEFRTVNQNTGDWNGGGKKSSEDPNVYDTLILSK